MGKSNTAKVAGITLEINIENQQIIDSWKDINKEIGTTQRSLRDVEKLLKLDPTNTTLLAQKQEYLANAIDETKKRLQQEQALLESLRSADNADETVEQQKALERQIVRTNQQLDKYEAEAKEMEDASSQMSEASEEAAEGFNSTAEAIDYLAKSMASSAIAEGAEQIAKKMMECVEASEKLETAMAKVQSIAQTDSASLANMKEQLKAYGGQLGISANDLAEAAYQAISAGVDSEKAVDFAAQATKLSVAGFTSAAGAVDVVTTALNAYGMEADEAAHVMDDLINTQNLGKITVDELAQGLGRIIPTAAAYHVTFDNLSAAMAELTNKGVPARQAVTYLNGALSELGDAGSDVSEILVSMTGKTFPELMDAGYSLGDVMALLYKNVGEDEAAFMGLWGQTTAATAAFNIASDKGEKFNWMLGEMASRAGATESAFEIMAETSEMTGKRFEVAVENMKTAIGDALTPTVDNLKEKGIEALEPATKFIEEHPELVSAIAGAAAAVVGVTTAITACAAAAAILKAAFGDLTGVAGILAATLGVSVAAGAIIGYKSATEDATDKVKQLTDASKELSDTLEKDAKERSDRWQALETEQASVQRMVDKLRGLEQQTSLTAQEQAVYKHLVDQLNQAIPDLNLSIDKQTGKLDENSRATLDNVEAMQQLARQQAAQEDYNRIIAEQYELDKQLYDLEQEQTAFYAEMTAARRDYNKAIQESQESGFNPENDMVELNQQLIEAADNYAAVRDLITENREKYEGLNTELARVEGIIGTANNAIGDNQTALEENADATQEWSEDVIKAYAKAHEAATTSINGQLSKFEELEQTQSASIDNMTQKFQEQAEGMAYYAELVAKAMLIMEQDEDSTGLLTSIINQGPSATGELQALVEAATAGAGEIQKFREACDAFNETQDIVDNLATMQAALESGYTEPLDAALEAALTKPAEINESLREGYTESEEDAEDHKEIMVETATATMEEVQQAIEDANEPTVEAMRTLIDDVIKAANESLGVEEEGGMSMVFYNMGMNIDNSLAAGIENNSGVVGSTIQSVINQAMESAMSEINRWLGEQLG